MRQRLNQIGKQCYTSYDEIQKCILFNVEISSVFTHYMHIISVINSHVMASPKFSTNFREQRSAITEKNYALLVYTPCQK